MLLMIMLPLCFKLCMKLSSLLVKYFELKSGLFLAERILILFGVRQSVELHTSCEKELVKRNIKVLHFRNQDGVF